MPRNNDQSTDYNRQLMIKVKTCQRLQKEVLYYEKEVKENEAQLAEMQAATNNYDSYDIKRFRQVLDESYMMIPDSQSRFKHSIEDLASFIDLLVQSSAETAKAATASEWYEQAKAILSDSDLFESQGASIQTNVDQLGDSEVF